MRVFVLGDLQGCLTPFLRLLDRLRFEPQQDRLVLLGDLVNRGPASLGVLREVRALGPAAICLLGNHDLHLLATARHGQRHRKDTLDELLAAPDADDLLDWLRHRPLAWQEPTTGTLMVHAGVAPTWTVADTLARANDVTTVLQGADHGELLDALYGNTPDRWQEALTGIDRWRCIINILTRMRFIDREGRLDFRAKGAPHTPAPGLIPWFAAPDRKSASTPICFGHWSTLGRVHWPEAKVYGLDTGCVWGGHLSALELISGHLTQVPCEGQCAPGAD